MSENTHSGKKSQGLLEQMGRIPVIVQGKVSERRSGGKVTGFKLRLWRDGRNETRHIPAELAETLQRKGLGEVTWLEHGLREASQGMCRDVMRWLRAMPGLRVPGYRAAEGERRVASQERTVQTLFGDIRVSRN